MGEQSPTADLSPKVGNDTTFERTRSIKVAPPPSPESPPPPFSLPILNSQF